MLIREPLSGTTVQTFPGTLGHLPALFSQFSCLNCPRGLRCDPYSYSPYKRGGAGSNPAAPTRKGQVRPHVDLDKTLSPESQREPPVHARGCGNGAPRAGSIIVDHEGAPCTDSRYHRHCRALDRGEPDGCRAPRAGPSDRLGAGRGPGRQSSIGCRAARTDRGETRSRLVGLGSRALFALIDPTPTLWVPRNSSSLRDQAILVDQTTDAGLSPDAVLHKIDRFG